jgi:two-component system phosphate regulon sensor histidine kinase PhoR
MAGRKRLLWRLYPSYLLIILLSVLAVAWYASETMKEMYVGHVESELLAEARTFSMLLPGGFGPQKGPEVDRLCKTAGRRMGARVTVILPSGLVIGDSQEDPGRMNNHGDRPEVKKALSAGAGTSVRRSPTLKIDMLYVAVPFKEGGKVTAVVRVSTPLKAISGAMKSLYGRVALGGLVVAVLAALVSLFVSRRINRPIEEMKQGAERFAKGELEAKVYVPDLEEMAVLAEALNEMASQLDERIRAVTEQRNELEAVLSSMLEAVIAVDGEERVIRLNHAARELLGLPSVEVGGRSLQEVIRNAELQQFVSKVLSGGGRVEGELEIQAPGERCLQASGTGLLDSRGQRIGAIIVLNDVTRLKKLEKVRRDFVANVSHELKTPITSIKGSIETLRDGAMGDPEHAGKFIDIIVRHTDRLSAIIEDILALSRIEESEQSGQILLEETLLGEILDRASSMCRARAEEKGVEVRIACPAGLKARVNGEIMEQALVNLLDNAIKFSEPGSGVRIEARRTDREIIVEVEDRGCGIAGEHLPRIFERFYRVDKARSRKVGGTGLGLAIVKHIVTAHGGRVTVESEPGKGSTFRIHLPF